MKVACTVLTFANGDVIEPLSTQSTGPRRQENGTRVTVWPDAKYFDSAAISLFFGNAAPLRSKAVLLPGVRVSLINAKTGETQTWQYDQGLRGYRPKR